MIEKDRKIKVGPWDLRLWVKCAMGAVIVMFFLIISSESYVSGDLYRPQVVLRRELFGGDLLYLGFNWVFYAYQIGLLYRFVSRRFFKEQVD